MNRKRILATAFLFASLAALLIGYSPFASSQTSDPSDKSPRFKLSALKHVSVKDSSGKSVTLYDPKDPYAIFINYELGMHCVGFDVSYCCVIPPYNSIQAQAIKTGEKGGMPHLLSRATGSNSPTRSGTTATARATR